ncbi:hypothetical protein BGZ82_004284, partial [Podila clonocystis]
GGVELDSFQQQKQQPSQTAQINAAAIAGPGDGGDGGGLLSCFGPRKEAVKKQVEA